MCKGAKVSARLLVCEDCGGGNCGGHFQTQSLEKTQGRTTQGHLWCWPGPWCCLWPQKCAIWARSCRSLCAISQFPSSCCCGDFKKMPLGPAPDDSEDGLLGHVTGAPPRALCSACCCGDNLVCSLRPGCRPVPEKTAGSQGYFDFCSIPYTKLCLLSTATDCHFHRRARLLVSGQTGLGCRSLTSTGPGLQTSTGPGLQDRDGSLRASGKAASHLQLAGPQPLRWAIG